MPPDVSIDRSRIAQKLLIGRDSIAKSVSDQFFLKNPDWLARYGERGRQICAEDVRFHLDFLIGALEAGSLESFADYVAWTSRMLAARGIGGHPLGETLTEIAGQVELLLSTEEVVEVSRFLDHAKLASTKTSSDVEPAAPGGGLAVTRDVFLSAILNGHRQAALNIINEALRSHPHVEIYTDVFTEALYRIGRLWERNEISVAQEHIATAVTQYVIASIYPGVIPDSSARGSMIVTGVAGELHQIGANLVADAMESKGWSVRFLGSNVPHAAVLKAVDDDGADVLCISTTLVANLPSATQLIRSLRVRWPLERLRIVLGGAAHRYSHRFTREVGLMATFMDLRSAIAALCN